MMVLSISYMMKTERKLMYLKMAGIVVKEKEERFGIISKMEDHTMENLEIII